MLNHYVTDSRRTVMLADPVPPSHPYQQLVARVAAQDGRKGDSDRTAVISNAAAALLPSEGSVLLLAHNGGREVVQSFLATHCGPQVRLTESGIEIEGHRYDGTGTAVIATCHRVDRPGSVLSLLYSATPEAATSVSRLLFFYGWNSVVVFKDGSVVSRGEWSGERDAGEQMEVVTDVERIIR